MFAHRMLAIVVAALFVWCMVRARTMRPRSPRLVRLSTLALVLLVAQILVGGANVADGARDAGRAPPTWRCRR